MTRYRLAGLLGAAVLGLGVVTAPVAVAAPQEVCFPNRDQLRADLLAAMRAQDADKVKDAVLRNASPGKRDALARAITEALAKGSVEEAASSFRAALRVICPEL
ncbi:hypothetical protein JOF53_007558 [Crossiella equi]|uniref:Uncharacterized protein n=1 Tax=Crossiella equi TaxID=130796 RepID=A0ABS5AQH2_9PSEU|nr:hypothetical protein [Crossiella equi]MBP2478686.1 hypothetical protein [Crossiella equi]